MQISVEKLEVSTEKQKQLKRNQIAILKINDTISEIKNLLGGLNSWMDTRHEPVNLEREKSKLSSVNNKGEKNTHKIKLLFIQEKGKKNCLTEICTRRFEGTLFKIAKTQKQSKMFIIDEWINNLWYAHQPTTTQQLKGTDHSHRSSH